MKTLNNLAILHMNTQRLSEAAAECKEALEIYRRLVAGSPEAYEPYVAGTLNNLALLFKISGRNEEALASAREALETYGRCAERNPKQLEDDLKDTRAFVEQLEEDA